MIEIGDRANARRIVEGEGVQPDVTVASFTVATVTGEAGALVVGTSAGETFAEADGWTLELSRKDATNLHLPVTVAKITAHLTTGFDVTLIGEGDVWRNPQGKRVQVDQILSWESASEPAALASVESSTTDSSKSS